LARISSQFCNLSGTEAAKGGVRGSVVEILPQRDGGKKRKEQSHCLVERLRGLNLVKTGGNGEKRDYILIRVGQREMGGKAFAMEKKTLPAVGGRGRDGKVRRTSRRGVTLTRQVGRNPSRDDRRIVTQDQRKPALKKRCRTPMVEERKCRRARGRREKGSSSSYETRSSRKPSHSTWEKKKKSYHGSTSGKKKPTKLRCPNARQKRGKQRSPQDNKREPPRDKKKNLKGGEGVDTISPGKKI